jgi:rod shape determining protein RodA
MNDFIFCVWAEETGYIGSIVLIALFAVLCLSGVWVAITASDLSGRILALGVLH